MVFGPFESSPLREPKTTGVMQRILLLAIGETPYRKDYGDPLSPPIWGTSKDQRLCSSCNSSQLRRNHLT